MWMSSIERFESRREVIGQQEAMQMRFQVVMGLVVIRVHGGLSERAVHVFDLAIGPRVAGLGQPMGDAMLLTDTIKNLLERIDIALAVGELDALSSSYRVDSVGHGGDQVPEELSPDHFVGCCMPLGISTCARTIVGDKPGELAFFGAHFGDIDGEVAARTARERVLPSLVTRDGWQAADAVPLQAPAERRAHQVGDGRLPGVQAIIQGEQRVPATRHD
jgi:hypothetical protein